MDSRYRRSDCRVLLHCLSLLHMVLASEQLVRHFVAGGQLGWCWARLLDCGAQESVN
jgi:hypothetical protein